MADFSLYSLRPFGSVKPLSPTRGPRFSSPPPVASEQEDQGLIKIKGGSASFITLNHTYTYSMSKNIVKEVERTYDEVRVKNPDDPEEHVDVKRPTEITTAPETTGNTSGDGGGVTTRYAPQKETPTTEILTRDNKEKNPEYHPQEGKSEPEK